MGFGAGHKILALGDHTYRVFRYAGVEFDDSMPVNDLEAEANMGGN